MCLHDFVKTELYGVKGHLPRSRLELIEFRHHKRVDSDEISVDHYTICNTFKRAEMYVLHIL